MRNPMKKKETTKPAREFKSQAGTARRGRPPLHKGEERERINTTIRPGTLQTIRADQRSRESIGQVLDRWAEEIEARMRIDPG
jgi:hypothetical protein